MPAVGKVKNTVEKPAGHTGQEDDSNVQARLARALEELTPRERRVGLYLRDHYPVAGLDPLPRFATSAGASPQTVLRLVAKLGFAGYREFQDQLRAELLSEHASPLGRWVAHRPAEGGDWLGAFGAHLAANLADAFERVVRADFEAAAALLAEKRSSVFAAGGRFTQPIARYLVRHLQIVRGKAEEIGSLTATWPDRLLDFDRRTVVVIYDIRRYQRDATRLAEAAAEQGATVILFTDSRSAPAARSARYVFVAPVEGAGAWDSSLALFGLTEALIARVTELEGGGTADRLGRLENLRSKLLGGP